MKRHAVQPFYRWLASWAIAMRRPSDLGYDDAGFKLPPLRIHDVVVEADIASHSLFPELSMKGISGRLSTRRGSLEPRLDAAVNLIHERGVPWIAWCGLNTESAALTAAIPNAVEVQGSDSYGEKVGAVQGFLSRKTSVLVSKVRILGYGLNFQHCSHMLFLGLGDSYEQYYQAIRRCWRFGQQHPVDVYVVVSQAEQLIVENVKRKEATADAMSRDLLEHMRDFEREELCA
jgi:Superfamily II DNA/RNA helicases, SNF2 family